MEYRQILSQLNEVKGLQSIVKKIVNNILEGQTLQRREGRRFDGRRPKKHKQQQNQEQQKLHKQQPRKSEGQEVWVPKVGSRLFFWIQAKIAIIGH